MEKTITLPTDKFERASKLDKLLLDGWTVKYVKDDTDLAIITKTDITEDCSSPMLLLD